MCTEFLHMTEKLIMTTQLLLKMNCKNQTYFWYLSIQQKVPLRRKSDL